MSSGSESAFIEINFRAYTQRQRGRMRSGADCVGGDVRDEIGTMLIALIAVCRKRVDCRSKQCTCSRKARSTLISCNVVRVTEVSL
jgi:hypothetical protein